MITSCHPAVLDTCESLNWEITSFRGERVQDSKLSSESTFDSLALKPYSTAMDKTTFFGQNDTRIVNIYSGLC
jgi:hypothetical protein